MKIDFVKETNKQLEVNNRFLKQPEAKIKVFVNLANKYGVKAEYFIISVFCFPAFFLW